MQQLRTRENHQALDLQDKIQQQIFALAMQVGVLKLLLKRDPEEAIKNIHKIEHLVQLVQLDLDSMQHLLGHSHGIPSESKD